MDFEWDEDKRKANIEKHGVDFREAALIFAGPVLTWRNDRKGEARFISLGLIDGEVFKVAHTERNGAIRLITAWKGGRNDRRKYDESIARSAAKDAGEG